MYVISLRGRGPRTMAHGARCTAPQAVMPDSPNMGQIVVGIDGSEPSLHALAKAIEEAKLRGADLHVLHAIDLSPALLHLPDDVTIDSRDLAAEQRTKVWEAAQPSCTVKSPQGSRSQFGPAYGSRTVDRSHASKVGRHIWVGQSAGEFSPDSSSPSHRSGPPRGSPGPPMIPPKGAECAEW